MTSSKKNSKLTAAQASVLQEIVETTKAGFRKYKCVPEYRPAKKLIALGLVQEVGSTNYHMTLVPTAEGVTAVTKEIATPIAEEQESVTEKLNRGVYTHCEAFEEFKKDVFADLDIVNHPKRELLFSKAWEMGHSSGYSEVYNYALDLVDLIK